MSAEVTDWQTTPKWCATIAKALATIHFLTIAATAYQGRILRKTSLFSEGEFVSIFNVDLDSIVFLIILLSPCLIPLIFRKSGELVMLCVIPIIGLFFARTYYLFQSEWFGDDSLSGKGIDIVMIWTLAISAVSAFIVIGWIVARAVAYISARIDALSAQ